MKFTQKNLFTFLGILFLGAVIGSLCWEILERLLHMAGMDFSLTIDKPVGFDLYILAIYLRANPGSIIGLLGGIVFFKIL